MCGGCPITPTFAGGADELWEKSGGEPRTNQYIYAAGGRGGLYRCYDTAYAHGGNTADEIIAQFQNTEQYNHEGEIPPNERITEVTANEDGTVNYWFTPEQFEAFKRTTYDTGRFQYGFGDFPSVKRAEYAEIDDAGIPWEVVTFVDAEEYQEKLPISSLFATVWPATYLGQYQIFCGVSADEWAVHVTVKDEESGKITAEQDFPIR